MRSRLIVASKFTVQIGVVSFTLMSLETFCEERGIHRELTTPYTLEQNSVAEWKNLTVVEIRRSLLKAKQLPNSL